MSHGHIAEMWPVVPVWVVVALLAAMAILFFLATRFIERRWWSSRLLRIGALFSFSGIAVGIGLWIVGGVLRDHRTVYYGSTLAQGGVLLLLPATLVLPCAALVHRLTRSSSGTSAGVTRRAFIRLGSASLPAVATLGTSSGLVKANALPTFPVVRLRYPDLHPDLNGLRILQLSDVHLGPCIGLDDLKLALETARARHRPDLIVVTGDLAENVELIAPALHMVSEVGARFGAFASLGNHEYIHDIAVTRPLYEASPVPLLVDSGTSIQIGRAMLFIGGANDPVVMNGDLPRLLAPSIEAAAAQAPPSADFRLLLCHRPEGHGPAAAHGFDLTLAGHTHGGQLGLFGRSLFERLEPGVGWWGAYVKPGPRGPSRLYTTSGTGHWLPFRIGCPTEMPLIVLEGPLTSRRRTTRTSPASST